MLSDASSSATELLASTEEDEENTPDIRYIKPEPASLGRDERPLTSSKVFWGMWLTPIMGIIAIASWLAYTRRRSSSSNASEYSRARETVLARLANIEAGASTVDAASNALHAYLEARLGHSTGGLPAEEIADLLRQHGVESDTTEQLVSLLVRLAEMRFAPSELADSEEIGRDVHAIVRKLDEEFTE